MSGIQNIINRIDTCARDGRNQNALDMIRITTLGSFEIRQTNGVDCPALLGHPKPAALLAYLATARPDSFHRRDTLTTIFWSEQDSSRARASLRQALYFLRQQLGSESLVTRGGVDVRLRREWVTCDVASFDAALERNDLAAAVELYGGPFLEGFHVHGAPEFERWVDTERDRLSRACAEALERLALEAADPAEVVACWRRLADHDPHRGHVALELMKALEAVGRRAAAIQVATKHASLLQEDLGATPDPDVEAFANQLRNRAPPQGSPADLRAAPPRPVNESDATLDRGPRRLWQGTAVLLALAVVIWIFVSAVW